MQKLVAWVERQRWFGGKGSAVKSSRVAAVAEYPWGALVALELDSALYTLPLSWSQTAPNDAVILRTDRGVLCDATTQPAFREWLFLKLAPRENIRRIFPGDDVPVSRVLSADQSNTAIVYGDRFFVKIYRRRVAGENPDSELTRFLGVARFPHVPPYAGEISWDGAALALATGLTPHESDAWPLALDAARFYFAGGDIASWLEKAALLGRRTAALHLALASGTGPDSAPEPFTETDLAALRSGLDALENSTRAKLREQGCPGASQLADAFLHSAPASFAIGLPPGVQKFRTHGDLHLGQILHTGTDFVFIDFEGEPARSLAERRAKRSPLRDVAGMLRSVHYAAFAAAPPDIDTAEKWASASAAAFLRAWKTAAGSLADGLPLLPLFLREKALYELTYELANRPAWASIPLRALVP